MDQPQGQKNWERQLFVEEVGVLFEASGLPRIAGRILGWLLICTPPHQTATELMDVLQASKASISTMTRLLMQLGLIERIRLPGQRQDCFRFKLNAWEEINNQQLARVRAFRQLAERGLELFAIDDTQSRQRLEEMRDLHLFFEQELPRLNERWQQKRLSQSTTLEESQNPSE